MSEFISIEEEILRLKAVRDDLKVTVKSVSENILGEASQILIGTAETKDEWGALQEQLHTYNSLMSRKTQSIYPDANFPYFARVVLDEPHHKRDVLLGYGSLVGSQVSFPIVDWRKAPVAKVFFEKRSGESFEQELPRRVSTGIVATRLLYGMKRGELTSVWSDKGQRLFWSNEAWHQEILPWTIPLSGGEGKAVRSMDPTRVWSDADDSEAQKLLDGDQREVLNSPPDESLLVLGGAGSGKTTVALLRLAKLVKGLNASYVPSKSMVIVPHEGLKRLCINILWTMNIVDLAVLTFDDWISREGAKIFKDLPKRIYNSTPSAVVTIKRSNAMIALLDTYLADVFLAAKMELIQNFPEVEPHLATLQFDPKQTLLKNYDHLQLTALAVCFPANKDRLNRFFSSLHSELYDLAQDRIAIFTDEKLLSSLIDEKTAVTSNSVNQLLDYSRRQFFSHLSSIEVEKETEAHIALDGRDETEEDEEDLYKSIDVEDYVVLFHLLLKKTGQVFVPGRGFLTTSKYLVIDEAQELSESELRILGQSLEKGGSVTLSGDEGQLTTSEEAFLTWDKVLEAMGLASVKRSRLMTNYRSTKSVAHFGLHVLGPLAKELPQAVRSGLPVMVSHFEGLGPGCTILSDTLRDLVLREENASIAVVCKDDKTAKLLYPLFEDIESSRLVLDGKFTFDPGIDFTTLDEVKGLEFDYVIIPDAHSFVYKEDHFSRRALYVALTRAVHGLWIFSTAKTSPLLETWQPFGEDQSHRKTISPTLS